MDTVVRYNEYGEIISSDVIGTNDDIKYIKPPKEGEKKKLKSIRKSEDLCDKVTEALGGFYWMIYYDNRLFDGLIDNKHIARIIYLATFLEYETNKLVVRRTGQMSIPLTEKDIKNELSLDRRVYADFKKEMVNNGILIFKANGIYLSSEWFYKGEVKGYKKNIRGYNGSFSRIYDMTVIQLYKQVSTRQHETLGYLFKLLPFCDHEYNIISAMPNTEYAMDKALSKQDIAELLGIEFETYKKVEKQLMRFYITVEDVNYYIIGKASFETLDSTRNYYVINPLVFNSASKKEFDKLERVWRKLFVKTK